MSMKRFQMFWSDFHREYVEQRAAHYGISTVEYLRRLIDQDREKYENQPKHQTQP